GANSLALAQPFPSKPPSGSVELPEEGLPDGPAPASLMIDDSIHPPVLLSCATTLRGRHQAHADRCSSGGIQCVRQAKPQSEGTLFGQPISRSNSDFLAKKPRGFSE